MHVHFRFGLGQSSLRNAPCLATLTSSVVIAYKYETSPIEPPLILLRLCVVHQGNLGGLARVPFRDTRVLVWCARDGRTARPWEGVVTPRRPTNVVFRRNGRRFLRVRPWPSSCADPCPDPPVQSPPTPSSSGQMSSFSGPVWSENMSDRIVTPPRIGRDHSPRFAMRF
jgi:hypothetical protein